MKIAIFIVMFLMIGALFIIGENNLALKDKENITKFINSYSLWFEKLFKNLGQTTGYIIKLDWLPEK